MFMAIPMLHNSRGVTQENYKWKSISYFCKVYKNISVLENSSSVLPEALEEVCACQIPEA